jgi:hypothetical protein
MKRPYFFIAIFSFFLDGGDVMSQSNAVSVRLELNITDTKEFGKLTSISTITENHSKQSIYLRWMGRPSFKILWRKPNGTFEDYNEGWVNDEVGNPNGNLIASLNGDTPYENKIYDALTDKFIDPFALKFYEDLLKEKKNLIKSKTDSMYIREWVKGTLFHIFYLSPKEIYKSSIGISSLPKGVYKIYFTYSFSELEAASKTASKNSPFPLTLPQNLKGFEQWKGDIKSDTLHINIR